MVALPRSPSACAIRARAAALLFFPATPPPSPFSSAPQAAPPCCDLELHLRRHDEPPRHGSDDVNRPNPGDRGRDLAPAPLPLRPSLATATLREHAAAWSIRDPAAASHLPLLLLPPPSATASPRRRARRGRHRARPHRSHPRPRHGLVPKLCCRGTVSATGSLCARDVDIACNRDATDQTRGEPVTAAPRPRPRRPLRPQSSRRRPELPIDHRALTEHLAPGARGRPDVEFALHRAPAQSRAGPVRFCPRHDDDRGQQRVTPAT